MKHCVDYFFVACVLCFACLAYQGSCLITAEGAVIDSDLATYAQGMAGADRPELFLADPVLHTRSPANSIPNAERVLANLLTPGSAYALGLLRAGALILVAFFLSWYAFGKWLFKSGAQAIILVSVVSITVWVGLGTFWGIAHSDPVPRVFHAALWPWMLMLAVRAYKVVSLRPLAMLVAGLGMWLHGVSALQTGALFFCAFFFHKPKFCTVFRHAKILFFSLLAFFLPVLLFLWPSLLQQRSFSPEELGIFAQSFAIRWHEDYGNILDSLRALFSPFCPIAYIFYGGIAACVLSWRSANERVRTLAHMMPAFLFAFFCVFLFSYLESHYAYDFGRVSMGHELVRGIRFLVPLSWIFIAASCMSVLDRFPKAVHYVMAALLVFVTVFLSHDKQYIAASSAVSALGGLTLPLSREGQAMQARAEQAREALTALHQRIHMGDTLFCLDDQMMAARYLAFCPLVYSFKDGYVFFYNKDVDGMRTWLTYTELVHKGEAGIFEAWRQSKATWYLTRRASPQTPKDTELVFENADWRLFRRRVAPAR